ncbi:MAG: DUF3299 domain-containing protein [Pirellulaceae bacterium]|nr:DUF3299 domain-containing protein [Pirellulaceae bacterium]
MPCVAPFLILLLAFCTVVFGDVRPARAQDKSDSSTPASAPKETPKDAQKDAPQATQKDAQPPAVRDAAADRTPTAPRQTVAPRSPRAAARSKGDITFDDLKFEIEKGGKFENSMLTKEIKALDKQTIKLRGYILPNSVYKSSGIENFVLVRDNMECCFGPGAAIYDCVMIYMDKGKTADFTTKPIAVRGKFEVEEFKFPDGTLAAIYKITAVEAK